MLVCMQMCPYQSWTNPAERVMSTWLSLMREKMSNDMEKAMKYKNTIAAVRVEI